MLRLQKLMKFEEALYKHQKGPKQVLLTHGKHLCQSLARQQSHGTTRYKPRHNCASLIPVLMENFIKSK